MRRISLSLVCAICANDAVRVGIKRGGWRPIDYEIARCERCGFVFVTNPSTDFEAIYDEAYYRGQGADPMVDYISELQLPDTIRLLEWEGIFEAVQRLTPVATNPCWLDYGCGMGGLVRYVSERHRLPIEGFDESMPAACEELAAGPRIDLATLESRENAYDIVTAIEVLEHVVDPMAVLRQIHRVLKPGGLFLYTTGNAAKFRDNILAWSYVKPEIHISFYEPRTLEYGLGQVGFQPLNISLDRGFVKIIEYKILKSLRRQRMEFWLKLVPWPLVASVVDRRFGVTDFPMAVKRTRIG